MNTPATLETKDQGPETTDPVFDYATAERTIIDRAEFARLIRKHKSLHTSVWVPDDQARDVVRGCGERCFGVDIPAKQAIARLNVCAFDAFVWEHDEYGPKIISWVVAPAWLQMKRRRDFVAARIPKHEERLARPAQVGSQLDAQMRAIYERDLISDRAEVAKWDAELAARKAQPVAA